MPYHIIPYYDIHYYTIRGPYQGTIDSAVDGEIEALVGARPLRPWPRREADKGSCKLGSQVISGPWYIAEEGYIHTYIYIYVDIICSM